MVRPACRESISALSAQRAGWLVLDGSRMPAKGYGVFFRELSRGAPGRNATALPLGYLLADGKAHSRSFILAPAMQPLEGGKYTVEIFLLKADAVILDNDLTSRIGIGYGTDLDYRLLARFVEFKRVTDEILE